MGSGGPPCLLRGGIASGDVARVWAARRLGPPADALEIATAEVMVPEPLRAVLQGAAMGVLLILATARRTRIIVAAERPTAWPQNPVILRSAVGCSRQLRGRSSLPACAMGAGERPPLATARP